ncbi:MAG: hypothetical protein ACRC4O_06710 [Giesbergeria sp.]
MSDATYKDLIAFKNDPRSNKKKPVKLGYAKIVGDKIYLQFDSMPAGGWWDGSVAISDRRDDDQRGGGGGGFGGRRQAFGGGDPDPRSREDDITDIPFASQHEPCLWGGRD